MTNFSLKKIILLLSCFSIVACSASDETTFDSEDCNPCKMFVTQTATTGNFGSASVADLICANDPNNPNDGKTYKALIAYGNGSRRACTSVNCGTGGASENVDWVLHASTSYTRADGTAIATTTVAGVFTSFPLGNSVSSTAGIQAWTGFDPANPWTSPVAENCSNWTSASALDAGTTGVIDNATNFNLAFAFNYNCNQSKRFICVEQ